MKIFWFCYLALLCCCTIMFLLRSMSYFELRKLGLKKYDRATDIKKKDEIWDKLSEATVNGICWLGVTLLGVFAILDCFIKIIKGWSF